MKKLKDWIAVNDKSPDDEVLHLVKVFDLDTGEFETDLGWFDSEIGLWNTSWDYTNYVVVAFMEIPDFPEEICKHVRLNHEWGVYDDSYTDETFKTNE